MVKVLAHWESKEVALFVSIVVGSMFALEELEKFVLNIALLHEKVNFVALAFRYLDVALEFISLRILITLLFWHDLRWGQEQGLWLKIGVCSILFKDFEARSDLDAVVCYEIFGEDIFDRLEFW